VGNPSTRRVSVPNARFGSIQRVMRRLLRTLTSSVLLLLVLAPAAQAYNDGRGFYGTMNDKVTTDAGFILILFFAMFVFVMSMIQRHLDKRKEARKAAQKAHLGNAQWRGGW
jgi:ABC-type nickel/cobalt efflux system permease component RcnA